MESRDSRRLKVTDICFAGKELWKCQKKLAIAQSSFKKIIALQEECAVDPNDVCYAQRVSKEAVKQMEEME